MAIPEQFTEDGVLAPGDHLATIDEVGKSFLVSGTGVGSLNWDVNWRAECVSNLKILVEQLWTIGINRIFIDGSFVEEKDHPNDIDGYFDCDFRYFASGQLETELNLLDPHKI